MKEIFYINWLEIREGDNVARYCINRMADTINFPSIVTTTLLEGGVGGDLDWGIHQWDEHALSDYGTEKFKGWRFYIGPDEHGGGQDIECFLSSNKFKTLLHEALIKFSDEMPSHRDEVHNVIQEYIA